MQALKVVEEAMHAWGRGSCCIEPKTGSVRVEDWTGRIRAGANLRGPPDRFPELRFQISRADPAQKLLLGEALHRLLVLLVEGFDAAFDVSGAGFPRVVAGGVRSIPCVGSDSNGEERPSIRQN
jgi:hypothetical protein